MDLIYKILLYVGIGIIVTSPVMYTGYRDYKKLRTQRKSNALSLQAYRMLIASHLAKQGIAIEGGYAEPHINWKHVDGPMLHLSTSEPHWLTWKERFMLHFNLTTMEELDMLLVRRKMGMAL